MSSHHSIVLYWSLDLEMPAKNDNKAIKRLPQRSQQRNALAISVISPFNVHSIDCWKYSTHVQLRRVPLSWRLLAIRNASSVFRSCRSVPIIIMKAPGTFAMKKQANSSFGSEIPISKLRRSSFVPSITHPISTYRCKVEDCIKFWTFASTYDVLSRRT